MMHKRKRSVVKRSAPPKTEIQNLHEFKCKEAGSIVVCLEYLSDSAYLAGLSDVGEILDAAIILAFQAGNDLYCESHPKSQKSSHVFLKRFCKIADPLIKKRLATKILERPTQH